MAGISKLGVVPEICSLFLAIAVILFTNYKIERDRLGQLVRAYSILTVIALTADTIRYMYSGSAVVQMIFTQIFLTTFVVISIVMTNYSLAIFNVDRDCETVVKSASYTAYGIITLFVLTSPLTKLVYYSENNELCAGPLSCVSFFAGLVMIISCLVSAINGKATRGMRSTVFKIILVVLIPCIAEVIFRTVVVSGVGLVAGLIMIVITFHDGRYNLEYGAEKLKNINKYLSRKLNKSVLAVEISGTTNKNRIYEAINDVITICKAKNLFMQDNRFFVINESNKDIRTKLERIAKSRKVIINVTEISEKYIENNLDILRLLDVNETYRVVNANELKLIEERKRIRNNIIDIADRKDVTDSRVVLFTQPIFNMNTGKFETAEALCRLKLEGFDNILNPARFMDIVTELKVEHELNMIMLDKACKFIQEADNNDIGFDSISVNFNPNEVCHKDFVTEVISTVVRNRISCDRIHIEITEVSDVDDIKKLESRIFELKRAGFEVYLDDFGTGHSNVLELIKLPVDVIKFDKNIIDDAIANRKSESIVISLARVLGEQDYKVLFEGVENEDGCTLAEKSNASYIQGYYYTKPMTANDSLGFIKRKNEDEERLSV